MGERLRVDRAVVRQSGGQSRLCARNKWRKHLRCELVTGVRESSSKGDVLAITGQDRQRSPLRTVDRVIDGCESVIGVRESRISSQGCHLLFIHSISGGESLLCARGVTGESRLRRLRLCNHVPGLNAERHAPSNQENEDGENDDQDSVPHAMRLVWAE